MFNWQFGGVGIINLDTVLSPFVKKSFVKHFKAGLKYLSNDTVYATSQKIELDNEELKEKYPKVYNYALDMLEREGRQATEALYHNLNTLESRQGSQVGKVAC